MSSETSVNSALAGYLAGQLTAEQLIGAVSAEYYRQGGNGKREALRPIMDVIERAHPGVVELKASEERPGFDVRVAERRFPKRYESELRQAVEAVLKVPHEERPGRAGLLSRIVAAVRKLFSA